MKCNKACNEVLASKKNTKKTGIACISNLDLCGREERERDHQKASL